MNKLYLLSFTGGLFGLTVTMFFVEPPQHSIFIEIARVVSVYLIGISIGINICIKGNNA